MGVRVVRPSHSSGFWPTNQLVSWNSRTASASAGVSPGAVRGLRETALFVRCLPSFHVIQQPQRSRSQQVEDASSVLLCPAVPDTKFGMRSWRHNGAERERERATGGQCLKVQNGERHCQIAACQSIKSRTQSQGCGLTEFHPFHHLNKLAAYNVHLLFA